VLDFVSNLLGIPSAFLKNALEIREMETKHGQQRGTTYKVPLNYVQACATRDALAKAVYARLFDWLVDRVNQAMVKLGNQGLSIGVLDIYGFEVFQVTTFFLENFFSSSLLNLKIEKCFRTILHQLCKREITTNLHRVHSSIRTRRIRS
jgi:myosin-1